MQKQNLQGLSKKQIVEILKTQETWPSKKIVGMVSSMSFGKERSHLVTNVKVGDVFVIPQLHHPALVLKRIKLDQYLCVMLTSTKGNHCITELNSRSATQNFITKCINVLDANTIKCGYMYSISSRKELKRIKGQINLCFCNKIF